MPTVAFIKYLYNHLTSLILILINCGIQNVVHHSLKQLTINSNIKVTLKRYMLHLI